MIKQQRQTVLSAIVVYDMGRTKLKFHVFMSNL